LKNRDRKGKGRDTGANLSLLDEEFHESHPAIHPKFAQQNHFFKIDAVMQSASAHINN
jgi:hypothetical protein